MSFTHGYHTAEYKEASMVNDIKSGVLRFGRVSMEVHSDSKHTIWTLDRLGHPDRIGTTPDVAGSTYKLSTRMLQSRKLCTRLCETTSEINL